MITLREYTTGLGISPFGEWFDDLSRQTARRIAKELARIEMGNFGDVKPVGGGVSEKRVNIGPGYRIYFGRDGESLVVLLAGGTKKR